MANDFNQNTVIKAKPKDTPYELRDGRERGLILRIQPSGKKAWIVELRNHNGRKRRKTIKINGISDANIITYTQAQKEAQAIKLNPEKHFQVYAVNTNVNSKKLGDFLDGPYKAYAKENIRSHTELIPRLKRNFQHLFARDLDKISEFDMESWQRSRNVSFKTKQIEFSYLKAALNRAVDTFKLIGSHQLERYNLREPKNAVTTTHKDPRYLLEEEEIRLRAALEVRDRTLCNSRESANNWRQKRGYPLKSVMEGYADYMTPLILLALNTGLRRGDLFELEWRHVDFELKHIRKVISKIRHTKFGKMAKTIPLSDEAFLVMEKWQKQTKGEGLIFPNSKTGAPLKDIKKAWSGILKGAEIQDFRFHDLRHSFASKLVMAGIDLNTVRELMCHSDIKMTLVYAHLSPGHKENAIDRVFNQKN